MPLDKRRVCEQLKGKFGFAENPKGRHIWYTLKLDGLPEIKVMVSHGGRQISDDLCAKMSNQLRVRRRFFNGMIDCQHSKDQYEMQIRDDPQPPFFVRSN